jgi:CRP-like cAMP-binding protein
MEAPEIVLNRILSAYMAVPPQAVAKIMAAGEVVVYPKSEMVFGEGRYNAFEYFQLKGVSHRYNTDSEQQQVTTGIFQNERVITPHFTRTRNGHSIFSLQALTECTFLQVPSGVFRSLMDEDTQLLLVGRAIVEKEFIRGLTYEVLFRAATARDRLAHFREHYPGLENLIPHTVIASFLGITPVSFSRLRSEVR